MQKPHAKRAFEHYILFWRLSSPASHRQAGETADRVNHDSILRQRAHSNGASTMSKGEDKKKETKKQPMKTMKEKKAEKKAKKENSG